MSFAEHRQDGVLRCPADGCALHRFEGGRVECPHCGRVEPLLEVVRDD